MVAGLPLQGLSSLGPGDLNPATDNTWGKQGFGGSTATSGTGKLWGQREIPTCCPFITPHLGYTKWPNRVAEKLEDAEQRKQGLDLSPQPAASFPSQPTGTC